MAVRVKICGITRLKDALLAVEHGADALGFNFWPDSKRYCSPVKAAGIIGKLPPFVSVVGVFVNASRASIRKVREQTGIGWVQLHGDESAAFCRSLPFPFIKALRVADAASLASLRSYRAGAYLLDAPSLQFGGSGRTFDWNLLRTFKAPAPVILAGGLTPRNVAEAIRSARPAGVDVASGVEASPGRKDARKMKRFIREAKEASP